MMVNNDNDNLKTLSIECDTLEEEDRCNPRCVNGKGACDEGMKLSFNDFHVIMF